MTQGLSGSLVALPLRAPIPLSRRPDLPVKQAYRWKDSHRLLEALKEKCLRNIIKPTSKPFREGHKSPVTHITGYELIILLIFKGHFFLSCRSLTFATGKRGGGDTLEPALTEVCHAMPLTVSVSYLCETEEAPVWETGDFCIFSLKLWRSGLCLL